MVQDPDRGSFQEGEGSFLASRIVQPGVVVRFFSGAGLTFDTGSLGPCPTYNVKFRV